jgi:quinoprotein glucose dehydrogenase
MKHIGSLPSCVSVGLIVFSSSVLPNLFGADEKQRAVEMALPVSTAGLDLKFEKWNGALNVPDPVACSVDPKGRVYVASTARRKVADLDIREFPAWIPDDVAFQSVEQKSAFLKSALAPGKLRVPKGSLKDHNGDGSVDWKDLTAVSDRIYQLRDTDGDGVADKITVFAEGLNSEVAGIAAGVLYHEGWVYATVAPDLWRFKDTDDDGVADVREIVAHGFGVHLAYAGHDMHGLSVGPDGRIYWSIGDKGVNAVSREGKPFYYPNEGCVMRVEPDGSHFEVYAHGLRNPQEPAFDEFGDLFAVDNDADFKGEKERFVYIAEGSDSGWRCQYQYLGNQTPWMIERMWETQNPDQAAYFLPPLTHSSDGPTGFKKDPGTALGAAQRGMFFLTEFPTGLLRGFRVERDGASFRRSPTELLHKGTMGTGLSWHPDGSLMMTDWAKGYPIDGRGNVYRIDSLSGAPDTDRKQTSGILSAGFESWSVQQLVGLMGHVDQRVRMGAQFELVKRRAGVELIAAARNVSAKLLSRVHAIWGMGQLFRRGGADPTEALVLLSDADAEVRAQTARVLGEAKLSAPQAQGLIRLTADPSPRVRHFGAVALGRLRVPQAVDALLAMAESDWAQPVLRQAAFAGLVGCASPAQLAAQVQSARVERRLGAVVALRRLGSPEAAAFLKDSDSRVVAEAVRAVYDGKGIEAVLSQVGEVLKRRDLPEPALRRAVYALVREGSSQAASRLLEYALNSEEPEAMRAEAMGALLFWKSPKRQDPVDGFMREWKTQSIGELLSRRVNELLGLKGELRRLAVEILVAYELQAKAGDLLAIVTDSNSPAELRAGALRVMAAGSARDAAWEKALEFALSESSPIALQTAAFELLLPERAERLVLIAERVLKKGTVIQKQRVVELLARAATGSADALLLKWGGLLVGQQLEASIQLDVLEAIEARGAAVPDLAAVAGKYREGRPGRAHRELLQGGDAKAGSLVVQEHLGANCMACHALGETGSTVGPGLRFIGQERDREYLLESLLEPSAKLAPGYGLMTLSLRDGSIVAGAPLEQNAEAVVLQLGDGKRRKVARSEVVSQTPAVSVMPPMLGILKPREIRDVVAYLTSLRPAGKDGGKAPVKPAVPTKVGL